MKYLSPTLEIFKLETSDIMNASSEQASMTVGDITIEGKKEEFFASFKDLLGK